jgi:hypothetical protein
MSLHSHDSQQPTEAEEGSLGNGGNFLADINTTPDENLTTHSAKRKRLSHSPGQRSNYVQKRPTLFSADFGLECHGLCSNRDAFTNERIENGFSTMSGDLLPAVIEIGFRLHPIGGLPFHAYQYTALIKTDPNSPELSRSRIRELIYKMGYEWGAEDIDTDILSPNWTRACGLINKDGFGIDSIDPSEAEEDDEYNSGEAEEDDEYDSGEAEEDSEEGEH